MTENPLQTSITCVLFDLDGTLVDTANDFVVTLNQQLQHHNKNTLPAETIIATVSDGASALIKKGFGIDENDSQFESLRQELLDNYLQQLEQTQATLYPGMAELLDQLESQGISWGIVTNKPEKYTLKLLDSLTLLKRCKALICPDHVSESKPSPEPILLACQRLNCDIQRTVYLGDHHRDMISAKNADVIAIAATYGYISCDTNIEQWGADFILSDSRKVIPLLNLLVFT